MTLVSAGLGGIVGTSLRAYHLWRAGKATSLLKSSKDWWKPVFDLTDDAGRPIAGRVAQGDSHAHINTNVIGTSDFVRVVRHEAYHFASKKHIFSSWGRSSLFNMLDEFGAEFFATGSFKKGIENALMYFNFSAFVEMVVLGVGFFSTQNITGTAQKVKDDIIDLPAITVRSGDPANPKKLRHHIKRHMPQK